MFSGYTLIKNREHKKSIDEMNIQGIQITNDIHRYYNLNIVNEDSIEYTQVINSFNPRKFKIEIVIKLDNPFMKQKFDIECQKLSISRPEIGSNIKKRFYVSKSSVNNICNNGIDMREINIGCCGKSISTALTPDKANDFSIIKGNNNVSKVMYVCNVACGNINKFPDQYANTSLIKEPEGYDSIEVLYARDPETMIFNTDRILINYIVVYKYLDQQDELNPPINYLKYKIEEVPKDDIIKLGNIFFNTISITSKNKDLCINMIRDLFQNKMSIDEFIVKYKEITTFPNEVGFNNVLRSWFCLYMYYRRNYIYQKIDENVINIQPITKKKEEVKSQVVSGSIPLPKSQSLIVSKPVPVMSKGVYTFANVSSQSSYQHQEQVSKHPVQSYIQTMPSIQPQFKFSGQKIITQVQNPMSINVMNSTENKESNLRRTDSIDAASILVNMNYRKHSHPDNEEEEVDIIETTPIIQKKFKKN